MDKYIVVCDTNVFISAIFWHGKSYNLMKQAIKQEIIVFISSHIIDEIRRVLARDFDLKNQEIEDIIDSIVYFTHIIEPKEKVNIITDDADNRILECALACYANFIVSYDKKVLELLELRGIKIITPEKFRDISK